MRRGDACALAEVLCSDKTGTLTLNVLQLNEPWLPDDRFTYSDMLTLAALASKRVRILRPRAGGPPGVARGPADAAGPLLGARQSAG